MRRRGKVRITAGTASASGTAVLVAAIVKGRAERCHEWRLVRQVELLRHGWTVSLERERERLANT